MEKREKEKKLEKGKGKMRVKVKKNSKYIKKKSFGKKKGKERTKNKDFEYIKSVCKLIKEKAHFLNEFWSLGSYFFVEPDTYDNEVIKKRWNDKTKNFIAELAQEYKAIEKEFSAQTAETVFKQTCEKTGMKTGEVMQLFRVCISGLGGGPALFEVANLIGCNDVVKRLETVVEKIK